MTTIRTLHFQIHRQILGRTETKMPNASPVHLPGVLIAVKKREQFPTGVPLLNAF